MSRMTHAAQIDLRFGDPARESFDFGDRIGPDNFARERFDLFGQGWIGANRQAQPVAKRVSRCASPAWCTVRTSTGTRIGAVGPDLTVARQVAFFPLAGVCSISLNSASSISWTLRRSAAPRTARRRSISANMALRRSSAMVVRRSIRSI